MAFLLMFPILQEIFVFIEIFPEKFLLLRKHCIVYFLKHGGIF